MNPEHWSPARFSELFKLKHGYAFPSSGFAPAGAYILVTPGNFFEEGGFRLRGEGEKYFVGQIPDEFVLSKNDLLVVMTEQTEGLLGSSALIPESGRFLHNQRLGKVIDLDGSRLAINYLRLLLNSQSVRRQISTSASGTKVRHSSPGKIGEVEVVLPPLSVQHKIAGMLGTWEEGLEKLDMLIAAKERHYYVVLELLLKRQASNWCKVCEVAHETGSRNNAKKVVRVLSVTNAHGFVLPEDYFDKRIASLDTTGYKIVRRGEYAYNPSRINVGSIARLEKWEEGIVSPIYVVFALNNRVEADYFHHWLNSHEARSRIRRSAQGSVRDSVNFDDFRSIKLPLPDPTKQTAIAECLNAQQAELKFLRQQRAALDQQKRGLMQQLLTGRIRTS